MTGLLEGIVDREFIPLATWIIFAAIGLVVLYAGYRILRMMTSGTFISGGRNRKARLAVMDAAAVDANRRLVLVRRDDVEHLILIGGTTDLVVERDIRMIPRAVRPAPNEPEPPVAEAPSEPPAQAALPPRAPAPARETLPPRMIERPAPPPPRPSPPPARPAAPPSPPAQRPQPAPRPPVEPAPPAVAQRRDALRIDQVPVAPRAAPPAPAPRAAENDIDSALLRELEQSLERGSQFTKPAASERSLDDEMSKLLGELSRDRKT